MKYLPLMLTLAATSLVLSSQSVHAKIEQTNLEVSAEMENATKALIIASGYSCKKIDAFIQQYNGDYRVVCNGWKYSYNIEDKGGTYIVTLNN
ncbi:hypothetical protein I2492_00815 [Budviciaceae bacterium CWB-B4]|uniref:Uncharacterized protein n=1 Tax=Limnobaculum xujianqingii TaxID=2738837 RepID=A0A9D7AF28_9GAMM|nr:hypothetical protein [Limnobaculum xujianqingii]MBK5071556.1 hypothetical protein [Limnobaculum xujianqingii]MBK5174865.1 hypothetical protein [Limnobaculum xujianqingii]